MLGEEHRPVRVVGRLRHHPGRARAVGPGDFGQCDDVAARGGGAAGIQAPIPRSEDPLKVDLERAIALIKEKEAPD